MTSGKKWLFTLGVSLVFVLGYTASLLLNRPAAAGAGERLAVGRSGEVPELGERLNKPFPAAELLDREGRRLEDADWRAGKVMLVLVTTSCEACKREGEFLRKVMTRRQDVKFIGAISFEQDDAALKLAETLFPFKVYRDPGMKLAGELNLSRVPVKIYLEDGVVKRSWDGAAMDAPAQQEFVKWLDELN